MNNRADSCGTGGIPIAGEVAEHGGAFMARRNFTRVQVGDRVIVQTLKSGQAEALVVGHSEEGVLIRISRWSEHFEIEPGAILRRLTTDRRAA